MSRARHELVAFGSGSVVLALAASCALPSYEIDASANCQAANGNGICERHLCPTDIDCTTPAGGGTGGVGGAVTGGVAGAETGGIGAAGSGATGGTTGGTGGDQTGGTTGGTGGDQTGGTGAAGSGGTGGFVLPATCPAAPVVADGSDPLIDDVEDGDTGIRAADGRMGYWFTTNDGTVGATQEPADDLDIPVPDGANASSYSVRTWGSGFTNFGAALGLNLHSSTQSVCPYDASAYGGIAMCLKGSGAAELQVQMASLAPPENGGTCAANCWAWHRAPISLTTDWQCHEWWWSELEQPTWGTQLDFDPSELLSLVLMTSPGALFDMYVDDVRFLEPFSPEPAIIRIDNVELAGCTDPTVNATYTFDSDAQGFIASDDGLNTATLSHTATGGNVGGALEVEATLSAPEQGISVELGFDPPINYDGCALSADVSLVSGGPDCGVSALPWYWDVDSALFVAAWGFDTLLSEGTYATAQLGSAAGVGGIGVIGLLLNGCNAPVP